MDRFESMAAFVAVARAGGFSAAARAVGVPLPTLSRRVADLESALGVRLLHRSTRQVVPTETGRSYFADCHRLLEDLKDAEEAASGEYRAPKGELAVTAPTGFGLLHLQPVALEFLAAYPEIDLRLLLVDRVVDLLEEHMDLALRIAELPDSRMAARKLGHVRMVVGAAPAYLERRGVPRHPGELTHHDCIAWSTLGPLDSWSFRERGADRAFPIHARMSTTTAESAMAAAQSGLGLVQTTSYQAERGVREGRFRIVLQPFECPATPVSLVYAGGRFMPLKLRAFIDFAAPRLSERLHSIATALRSTGKDPPKAAVAQGRARRHARNK